MVIGLVIVWLKMHYT